MIARPAVTQRNRGQTTVSSKNKKLRGQTPFPCLKATLSAD